VSARPLPMPINPALLKHADQRRQHLENRIADTITRFAGSMLFVYLHIIWFAAWIILGVEHYPYGLLTMIVSLEAIFLSTFVMIARTGPTRNARSWPIISGRPSRRKSSRTRSCCSCPTRSWSSPRRSTRWTPPGRPPTGTTPNRYSAD
jgi:hypothetical protein